MTADWIELQEKLADFVRERDWEQFHQPKNLVLALMGEAGELAEVFQWLSEEESSNPDETRRRAIANEIADVQVYLMLLANRLGLDPLEATKAKIELNAAKYPAEQVRGSVRKYDDYCHRSRLNDACMHRRQIRLHPARQKKRNRRLDS